jgi:hypothetical protein
MRTVAAAGLNVLPYHDNVPSFGDWGWVLASPSIKAETLFERADTMMEFGVQTDEIDASNLTRALIFNRGGLTANSKEISTYSGLVRALGKRVRGQLLRGFESLPLRQRMLPAFSRRYLAGCD